MPQEHPMDDSCFVFSKENISESVRTASWIRLPLFSWFHFFLFAGGVGSYQECKPFVVQDHDLRFRLCRVRQLLKVARSFSVKGHLFCESMLESILVTCLFSLFFCSTLVVQDMKDIQWEEKYGLLAWLFPAYILSFHFSWIITLRGMELRIFMEYVFGWFVF